MVLLKRFFNFYIEASIHVALSVFALTYISLTKFNLDFDKVSLFTAFFATVLGYNFVKFYSMLKKQPLKSNFKLKLVVFISVCSGFTMLNYVLKLQLKSVLFLLFYAVIILFYVFPFKSKNTLRTFPGVKVFVIAFVWSGVALFLPLLQNNVTFTLDVLLVFLQYFLLVVVLMLPFEIRDLKYDLPKLRTLPQVIGVKNTKIFGQILLIFLFLIEFLKDKTSLTKQMPLFFTVLVLWFLLKYASENQSKYYSSFFVESIPVLWLVLVFFF